MKTKITKIGGALLGGAMLASMVLPVFAEEGSDGSSGRVKPERAGTSASSTVRLADRMDKIQERDYKMIDKRIETLRKMLSRIENMKRVSDATKESMTAELQGQINNLLALKAKIEADTDVETLKEDSKSITKAYRVYALVHPRAAILAAADRINPIVAMLNPVAGKLDTRIAEAKAAGKDTSAAESFVADLKLKTADATAQASAAVALVSGLNPDNGDEAIAKANRQALKDARAKIKAGHEDVEKARKDARSAAKALKGLNVSDTASTTPE